MSYDAITRCLPTNGALHDYIELTSGGEICPRFRFFSFATMVGAVLGRKVALTRTSSMFSKLYPNLWVVLVAPQGIGHKSASLRIAKSMTSVLPLHRQPNWLASKLTPEALVKALASPVVTEDIIKEVMSGSTQVLKRKAQGVLFSSELGVLLGREKYNQGMIALLTDLYDCPDEWSSGTVMRGNQKLYDVCLSVAGASTPDWMQSMLPSDAFRGGFMSRLLLICYPEVWHIRVADPPEPDAHLLEEVKSFLLAIQTIEGQMFWTPSAREFFNNWYNSVTEPEPGPRAAYLERKQDHMLRLAMIVEIAETRAMTLHYTSIETALNILNAVEPETLKAIDFIAVEPRMRMIQRFIEVFEQHDLLTETEVLNKTWQYLPRLQDFGEIVSMLVKMKKIQIVTEPGCTELTYKRRKQ